MTRPHRGEGIVMAAILTILGAGCAHGVPAADSGTDSLDDRQAAFLSSLEAP